MARKDYIIKLCICFEIDKEDQVISILPTIMIQPWKYRYPNTFVVDITWLIFHIGIGRWRTKGANN